MTSGVLLPPWAVGAFVTMFLGVVGLAAWGLRTLGSRLLASVTKIDSKIEKVDEKVVEIDKRVVRIETLMNGGSGPRFPRQSTPPPYAVE